MVSVSQGSVSSCAQRSDVSRLHTAREVLPRGLSFIRAGLANWLRRQPFGVSLESFEGTEEELKCLENNVAGGLRRFLFLF
jgi:hypothetical protein